MNDTALVTLFPGLYEEFMGEEVTLLEVFDKIVEMLLQIAETNEVTYQLGEQCVSDEAIVNALVQLTSDLMRLSALSFTIATNGKATMNDFVSIIAENEE